MAFKWRQDLAASVGNRNHVTVPHPAVTFETGSGFDIENHSRFRNVGGQRVYPRPRAGIDGSKPDACPVECRNAAPIRAGALGRNSM